MTSSNLQRKVILTTTQDTIFKIFPIDSQYLNDKAKQSVPGQTQFDLLRQPIEVAEGKQDPSQPDDKSHYYITLTNPYKSRQSWYIFKGHVKWQQV
ncbi:hypothetical protein BZZ01_19455 [Nostocales cyanobacterium HT-58-2]|nr:hypothetical protein BZZ01_19455 [Nostocales cyanobacterium HT-58-2]